MMQKNFFRNQKETINYCEKLEHLRYPINQVVLIESTNTSQVLDACQGHLSLFVVMDYCM